MLRFVTPDDTAELLEIYRPYIEQTAITFEYDVPTLEEYARRIAEIATFFPYLVWEENGRILGYAYAHALAERAAYQWDAELSIYLRQEATGRGLGRKLYAALLELLKLQGIRTAYACVTIPNPASEGLHAALGFQQAGVWHHSGYKAGAWRDVAWLEKQLLPYEPEPTPPAPIGQVPAEHIRGILNLT